jgi:hypothetical protein
MVTLNRLREGLRPKLHLGGWSRSVSDQTGHIFENLQNNFIVQRRIFHRIFFPRW